MIDCVIFDLDGTMADLSHRLWLVEPPLPTPTYWKPNYPAFHDACVRDEPVDYVIRLNRILFKTMPATFICSGRPDSHRGQTEWWLKEHKVLWHDMFMRKAGDSRPDPVVKKEMLDNIRSMRFNPVFAVDDRPSVVAMWRANGVPCFVVDDTRWKE